MVHLITGLLLFLLAIALTVFLLQFFYCLLAETVVVRLK